MRNALLGLQQPAKKVWMLVLCSNVMTRGVLFMTETMPACFAGIRRARYTDLEGVDLLLQPLVKAGVLVSRSLDELAELLPSCTVIERDNKILGCAVLLDLGTTPDGVRVAEVGAFCVDPQYRCAVA